MIYNNKSGIYRIKNIISNKEYIGQSINLSARKTQHFYKLRNGSHKNKDFQKDWDEYGEKSFLFEVILICEKNQLTYYEQKLVDIYNPSYNKCKICVDSVRGFVHSQESRLNMSIAHLGKHPSEATRAKMSKNRIGMTHTQDELFKMSVSQKGRGFSEEHRKNLRVPKSNTENFATARWGIKNKDNATSKYVGVSLTSNRKRWRSFLKVFGKQIYIGTFDTEIEAALAYNEVAEEMLGWKARINNIPKEDILALWEAK